MKINLPFGNSVDIQEPVYPEYQIGRKYRFKMTDMYGWDINKSQARDMRISDVLDEKSNEVLYHLYLTVPGKIDTPMVWIDLNKSELKISGDYIMVKFKCESLIQAEKIIDMILEPNGLEVAPVNLVVK
jgi:hypothetical protein